jgi:hypothetical protein
MLLPRSGENGDAFAVNVAYNSSWRTAFLLEKRSVRRRLAESGAFGV